MTWDKPKHLAYLQEAVMYASKSEFESSIHTLNEYVQINKLVNYYTHLTQDEIDIFDDIDEEILQLIVNVTQLIYNNSEDVISPISDEDYDKIYELFRDVSGTDIVGAGTDVRSKVISAHRYPELRGTLDKIHFITNDEKPYNEKRKSLEDWIKSTESRLGRQLQSPEVMIMLTPKWDGISSVFELDENQRVDKVLKRGDTLRNEAEEITSLFKGAVFPEYVNINEPFGLKTEIVMTHNNFKLLCEKYGEFKSPRSAVSSIINSKEPVQDMVQYLTVIPLRYAVTTSSNVYIPSTLYKYPMLTVSSIKSYEEIKDAIDKLTVSVRDLYGVDIDGIVITLLHANIQEELGRENNINKYEVAYKLPPEQARTTIKDVLFSVGILGSVTPVAKVEPVKMKGNTISSISLGSIERFKTLNLAPGDEVLLKYDVIPYLDVDETCKKSGEPLFEVPSECPYCGKTLANTPELKCLNEECDSRVVGKILNYVEKMSIPNISIGIITALWERKILLTIADLYRLGNHESEILDIPKFGKKSFKKILAGIDIRREVFDYELVGSLGIPSIGRRTFKKILELYTLDELLQIVEGGQVSELTLIAGIKEKTARKIIDGLKSNASLLVFLRNELKLKRDDRKYTIKVAFTKVRDKEFEEFLDKKDVLVLDSYKKEVDMLIVPDYTTTSSKVDKARKDGKEIVSIADAYKLFKFKEEK